MAPKTLVPFGPFITLLRAPICRWSFTRGSSTAHIFNLTKGPLGPHRPSFALLQVRIYHRSCANRSSTARIFRLTKGPPGQRRILGEASFAYGHVIATVGNWSKEGSSEIQRALCQRKNARCWTRDITQGISIVLYI